MREDIETLEATLAATEFRCVSSGVRSTSDDIYPAVKSTYPSLCDDSLRCDTVCSHGADQPEWKHAVRRVQQQLADRDGSRVSRHPEHGMWEIAQPDLFLIPVSDDWLPQYHATVSEPVLSTFAAGTPPSIAALLPARIWGATAGSQTERYFEAMSPGDWMVFYHDGGFIGGGRVGRTIEDPAVGAWLWDNPASRYLFTVVDFREWGPAIGRVWEALGYQGRPVVQGFMRVKPDRVASLRAANGSLEAFLYGPVTTESSETPTLDRFRGPEATETDAPGRYTTVSDRILRDQTTVTALKEQYQYRCQICGQRRYQTPTAGYAEVHHLKPLGNPHSGPDIPENMLVVCPNHHADFDTGMVAIRPDEYTIAHGYDDTVAGSVVTLEDRHTIAPTFLEYHLDEIADSSLV